MYSSCLICHRELGTNGKLEHFPIGQRIAFDPDTGRVWAVCESCGEWNLAPIEDRWEAVEECQRRYDETVERGGALGVAVAKAESLELIRIGSGSGSELMTLRYGRRLRKRRRAAAARRWVGYTVQAVTLTGVAVAGGMLAGPAGVGFAFVAALVALELTDAASNPVVARVPVGGGRWTELKRRELREARLVPGEDEDWHLRLQAGLELRPTEAVEAARYMLPLLNRMENPDDHLRKARNYIRKKGGTVSTVFVAAARRRGKDRAARLSKLDPHIRLALEILACEAVERHSATDSFLMLRQAWEHAHELATIQDDLLFGPGISTRLRELRS